MPVLELSLNFFIIIIFYLKKTLFGSLDLG